MGDASAHPQSGVACVCLPYLRHGCRLLLVVCRYAVVLPRLLLCGHERLGHVEALLRLLWHLPGESVDMGHLWLLPWLLWERLGVPGLLLRVAREAVGSSCMTLGARLGHGGCSIRWRRTVLALSIPLWLPRGPLHGACWCWQMLFTGGQRVLLQTLRKLQEVTTDSTKFGLKADLRHVRASVSATTTTATGFWEQLHYTLEN